MKYIEIEIRIYLEDDSVLVSWLKSNAQYIGELSQEDIYYQPIKYPFIIKDDEGYKDADQWLRVRTSRKGTELCYKYWHRDSITKESLYADEVESTVGDKEAICKILELLGYEVISLIDKTRESWIYNNFKIERDCVKGLGNFYEIEFTGQTSNPEKGKEIIFDFLTVIGIENWKLIDRGYPWMQWNNDW
ncbi:MAG: class IV adenylate cyclase [Coleofasciculus sp. A1-SPW-01]|uniref:class IV adenylate cyclase n=1 Tax=Coleofasciculus sp. A1-SPW-01 TaxID=3070819 RepID=UPI0032FE9629